MTNECTEPSVEELREMLSIAANEEGVTVFDHTPEEIGLHVMENHVAILAALSPQPATSREAVAWVSPGQLAAITDDRLGEFGTYLPIRKKPAGNFTQLLYALTPAPAAGVEIPEGYALVPIEPTEAMITSCLDVEHNYNHWRWASKIWKAMLAATPTEALRAAQVRGSGS